jgi:hypothetical protein
MASLLTLPTELVLEIISWLPPRDQLSLVSTCRRFRILLSDTSVRLVIAPDRLEQIKTWKYHPRNIVLDKFLLVEHPLNLSFLGNIKQIYIRDNTFASEIQCLSASDKILYKNSKNISMHCLRTRVIDGLTTFRMSDHYLKTKAWYQSQPQKAIELFKGKISVDETNECGICLENPKYHVQLACHHMHTVCLNCFFDLCDINKKCMFRCSTVVRDVFNHMIQVNGSFDD